MISGGTFANGLGTALSGVFGALFPILCGFNLVIPPEVDDRQPRA